MDVGRSGMVIYKGKSRYWKAASPDCKSALTASLPAEFREDL